MQIELLGRVRDIDANVIGQVLNMARIDLRPQISSGSLRERQRRSSA